MGKVVPKIHSDAFGLIDGMKCYVDYLGNDISDQSIIGAIAPKSSHAEDAKLKNKNID